MPPEKQHALLDILDTMKHHNITVADITAAQKALGLEQRGFFTTLLSYFGGILLFAGLCVFANTIWDDIGPAGHLLITLVPGFFIFMGAGLAAKSGGERLATPMFLVAGILETIGLVCFFDELTAVRGDIARLIISGTLFLQFGLTAFSLKLTMLVFGTAVFGTAFVASAGELAGLSNDSILVLTGSMLVLLGVGFTHSHHKSIAGLAFLFGSSGFLFGLFEKVERTPFELVYLAVAALLVYVSTLIRSRTLLGTSTVATVAYLVYFSYRHFANTLGWPLILISAGVLLLIAGRFAVQLDRKYMR